jgi:acetyltransferase-like isoleucine patch superfamily enzyme
MFLASAASLSPRHSEDVLLIQKPRIPIKEFVLYGLLPGFLKKVAYRLKGYHVGKKVSLGFGSIICGKDVEIGDHSKIGFFTIVRGEKIKIGSHVSIGSTTFLDTPFIEIGDETKINEQVFVGGLQSFDSKFIVGRNCQIMQQSFLNPAKSIVIGDDSCIGGLSLLFGHNSWLSQFEGYDVTFEPIEIGNNVGIAWRVFVLAGVRIGDGSMIAPNSLVSHAIPPRSLAAGFPARVISKQPDFPKAITDEQKIDILRNIMSEMIAYFKGSGLGVEDRGDHVEVIKKRASILGKKRKAWRLGVSYEIVSADSDPERVANLDVFVSLRALPAEVRKKLNAGKVMWLDIEKKERPLFWNDLGDEVALYLRRYGVRFHRVEA